jgi:hypothetical protein
MRRCFTIHESRIGSDGRLLWLVFVLGAIVLALALATTAAAGTAYYSLEGWFANGSETQSILFSLQSSISEVNNDPFSLRTWQNGGTGVGETNAAGDVINAGGFDPVLSLYKIESDGSVAPMASNDDHFGLDSQITWGTSGLTELPFGDYRLDLTAYGSTLGGRQRHWGVDLVGKSDDLPHGIGGVTVLSGIDRSGITTLKSLKFGATGNLLGAAHVIIASGEALAVSGDFEMRDTGRARADVDNGALVASRVHISPGTGMYLLNGGTVSTSELVVEGILWGTGAVILPDAGELRNQGRIEIIDDSFGLFRPTITVPSGHYVQESGGVLEIGIGGTGLADYGRLTILNGTALLAGLLHVDVVGSFVPSVGQSFEIITAADGFLTTFEQDHISLPDISGSGLGWDVAYSYGPDGWSMVLTTFALGAGSSSGAEYAVPEPSGLTLMALAAAIGLVCRSLRRAGHHLGMVMLLFVSTSPAAAGDAYWSFEGWFADGSETQSFLFDVFSDIPNTDPFTLRTWHATGTGAGQTNAAGDAINAGGFDSRLWLYDSAVVLKATSDDGVGTGLDSLIGWNMPNLPPYSIPTPNPLPAGDYRLDLTAFNATLLERQPHWAVDLVGRGDRMMLTGVGHSGVSVLKSLKFGSVNTLVQYDGRVWLAADQSLVMSDDFVIQSNGHMYDYGLISAGNVEVEPHGWLDLYGGTLAAGNVVIHSEAEIFRGALQGVGDVVLPESGSLENRGVVAPGHFYNQAGTLYLVGEGGIISVPSGNYVQNAAGTFYIGVGGTGLNEYGRLDVYQGSAVLDGTLIVRLADLGGGQFKPGVGERFEIFTAAGGLDGTTFATEQLPTLAGGLYFDVLYSRDAVTLAVQGILGDYNRNGVVDAADYTVWRNSLGATGTGLAADGDNTGASTGVIDQADYAVWKTHFGMTAGSGALSGATVPEPGTMVLLILAATVMRLRRRQTE